MGAVQEDGAPLRDHLATLAERGDPEAQFQLDQARRPPVHADHLWRWFTDLSNTRGFSEAGPNPLTRQEIRTWEADEFITLAPWERNALLRLDLAWRAWFADDRAERTRRSSKSPPKT